MFRLFKALFKREEFDILAAESSVQGLPLLQQIASGKSKTLLRFRLICWDMRTFRIIPCRHDKGNLHIGISNSN